VRRVVDKLALISSVSRSFNSTNVIIIIIIIIIIEFLSEGQAGEPWESSKKSDGLPAAGTIEKRNT
jgi:hypothetical protein